MVVIGIFFLFLSLVGLESRKLYVILQPLWMDIRSSTTRCSGLSKSGRAQKGLTPLRPICAINSVLKSIPLEELVGLVNEPLTKTAQILDFDKRRGSVTDDEVLDFLHEKYGINNAVDLQHYSKERRNDILRDCKDFGATIRQLSRLTDLGEKVIRNA